MNISRKMLGLILAAPLTLILGGCPGDRRGDGGPLHPHESAEVEMNGMLEELGKGGSVLTKRYQDLNNSLNRKILGVLGISAATPINNTAVDQEVWINVFLFSTKVDNRSLYFLVNTNNQSNNIKLDLSNLMIKMDNKDLKLVRTYSKDSYIEWWFSHDASKELVQLYLQPNFNSDRLEGTLHRFLDVE